MALGHSPSIVRDGLVMYYDMSNTKKSWMGAPTTNYATNSETFAGTWNNYQSTLTYPGITPPQGCSAVTKLASGVTGASYSFVNFPTAYTTFSVFAKAAEYTRIGISNRSSNTFGIIFDLLSGAVISSYNGVGSISSSGSVYMGDGWYRIWITVLATNQFNIHPVPSAEGTAVNLTGNGIALTTGSGIYISGAQIESLSFVSPYVQSGGSAGNRLTTQAILDLTNNNTLTATSLTYAADGTFSFNGTSNYITVASLANYNFGSNITVEVIHKNIGGDYRGVVSNEYSTGTGFDMRYGRENYFGGANNGTNLTCQVRTSIANYAVAINAELNVWGHYAFTYDGSNIYSYKNGALFTTTAATGTLGTNTNPVTIGRNSNGTEYLSGSLQLVKIYNRALTATEVDQNFQATRDRYGI